MPLTGVLVLIWLHTDNRENNTLMISYTKAALIGIVPTILFYLTAYFCFLKKIPFTAVILISFAIWFAGAVVHHYLFK